VRAVALAHADPHLGPERYKQFLGVRPTFSARAYAIELDGSAADWPIATANNELFDTLDAHAQRLLAELSAGRTVTDAVVRAISNLLKGEPPRIELAARGLAMSPRALQRSLQEEGTTYHDLLDQTRHGLAVRYLADSRAVIFDVAYLLGFSEPSAFHPAFRRWTGRTPRQFSEPSQQQRHA
jgi:AraC-like DNA-binding protein